MDNNLPQFDIIDYVSLESLLKRILLQISDKDLSGIIFSPTDEDVVGFAQDNKVEQMFQRLIQNHNFLRDYSKEITDVSKHFDFEPQTPTCNSWICIVTAHAYLIPAAILACCKHFQYNVLSGILCGLYITSVWHWHKPHFKGLRRGVDVVMVMSTVFFSTYCATMLPGYYPFIWYASLFTAGICFFVNRLLYYYQVELAKNLMIGNFQDSMYKAMKSKQREAVLGMEFTLLHLFSETFSLEITWPNTIRRDYAQYRTVLWHAVGVHLVTAFGGIGLSYFGYKMGL